MIGTIMGIGGAAMGAINASSASKQSWENEVKLMDIQAELNRQNAKFNNQMAKDMWHYTNFSNQMKEIKKAGLSPGLIYGTGGQGGSTAGNTTCYVTNHANEVPLLNDFVTRESNNKLKTTTTQYGLRLKTYNSDLYQNWINTEWIEGVQGVNEISSRIS